MGQFASKGVGTAALTTGIIGTAGVGLAMLSNGGLNLGGLFGNNRATNAELQYVSQLQSENAMLKAENYSDKVGKEVYMQSLSDNRTLADKMEAQNQVFRANLTALNDYAHNQAVEQARLQEKPTCCSGGR